MMERYTPPTPPPMEQIPPNMPPIETEPQPELQQMSIESFFEKFGIVNDMQKIDLLPKITDLIYDRNQHIVKLEKEVDPYVKEQIVSGIKELEANIEKIIHETKSS